MKFAIVGKAAILPNMGSFTDNLKSGIDNKVLLGHNNNIVKSYYDVDVNKYFDPGFFGYTPKEAEIMDDQHKALIYLSWKALNSYGFLTKNRLLARTGVVTAVSSPDKLFKDPGNKSNMSYSYFINNIPDTASTKISYKFNLRGPSINVNSACSSSFSALKTAQLYLKNKDIDMAVVGAAKVYYLADEGYQYVDGGIFSKRGECRPFDEDADGTVPGSGQFVYLIRRLDDAIKDNDEILGIIYEVSVNNDGNNKTSYTAPSYNGQVEVINQFYKNNKISRDSIDYLETHGTATKLGDALEVSTVTETFQRELTIGSVKSNYGHLDTASGLLSIYKALDMINKQYIPPIANFKEKTQLVKNLPLKIPKERLDGPIKKIAINSFGIGGTNGHVVVEQYNERRNWVEVVNSLDEKIQFPIYTKVYENLPSLSKTITDKIIQTSREDKLRIIRTLLLDQKPEENSQWYEYDFNTNKCIRINGRANVSDQIRNIFSLVPKICIDSEQTNLNKGKNETNLKEANITTKVWRLVEEYTNLPKQNIQSKRVNEIDVDSFILIELVDEINSLLNREIPFDYFINYTGRIDEFIFEVIKDTYTSEGENINIIHGEHQLAQQNIVLFHPAGGMTSPYKVMMEEVSANYNVILVSFPKELITERDLTISQLADIYIQQLKNRDLFNGNVILGGYSFGGNIAYEVAKKLPTEEVDKLLLIDSHPFTSYISKESKNIIEEDYNKAIKILIEQDPSLGETATINDDIKTIWKINHEMLKRYESTSIKKIDIEAVLFRCKEPENGEILTTLNIKDTDKTEWDTLFKKFKIIDIPGDHYSIFSKRNLIKTVGTFVLNNLLVEVQ